MEYQWDGTKNRANISKHGVDFSAALFFDWDSALIVEDTRRDYGETRLIAVGPIAGRLHVLCFTRRMGKVRIISLRKANSREVEHYDCKA